MKMFNNIKNFTFCAILTLLSFGVVSCTDNGEEQMEVTEGVVFKFDMRTVYTVSNMSDIVTVDVTLIKDGEEVVLPNLRLFGDESSVLSMPVLLSEGVYTMKGYVAYGASAAVVMECEFDLEDADSTFEIAAQTLLTVDIPVSVRVVNFENYIVNALIGLCYEVFGADESLWPWDKTEELGKWKYLEFEYFDGTNTISHLSGIHFNSNEFEGWNKMTKLPSGTIGRLITLGAITFENMPNLTELSDDLHELPSLISLIVINTGLLSFPENLEKSNSVATILIDGAEMAEFPSQVNQMKKLTLLGIANTKITEVTAPLTNLKLIDLDLNNNEITTFGESVLSPEMGIRSINLSGNDLTSLPTSFGGLVSLKNVNIMRNKFTSIPTQLESLTGLVTLRVGGEQLASISSADISYYPQLLELDLRGSKSIVLGGLVHANISGLYISDCNLSALPSIAGLPKMRLFEAANNNLTSIAELDFTANAGLTKINLSNNANLTSLPTTTWGLSADAKPLPTPIWGDREVGGFTYLNVSNCPNLNWTPNASWKAFESVFEMYDPSVDPVNPNFNVPDPDGYKDRVGVAKKGSVGVVL